MTLVARDEANNEGRSSPHEFRLPQRLFVKPLARALIEQRRNLALDAEARGQVSRALDALTIAPDKFIPEKGIYLGLRSIYWQLANAKSDDHLREVVQRLWQMAVNIEDGNVSDAEAALRAAQEALRQALERGATDEEIKKLMEQLRAALDKFMQALAEEMRKNPQQLARPLDRNAREIRPQDLKSMLDRIENLARSGAKDAARRLLEELQSILENLQMARPGPAAGRRRRRRHDVGARRARRHDPQAAAVARPHVPPGTGPAARAARAARPAGSAGPTGTAGPARTAGSARPAGAAGPAVRRPAAEPAGVARAAEEAAGGVAQARPRPAEARAQGQQGQEQMDQLGRAGEAMGDAEGQLGDGNADGAVDSQGRALDAMRKGAQGLAQMMQQQQGPGTTGQPGRHRARRAPSRTPIRSAGRCAGATTATTPPSRCRARSTCSARAASWKSCAGASASRSARSSSSTTSSGC